MNKEGQISEECYEALKEAFEEDIKERTARAEKEPSDVYDIYESNKEFRDAVKKLAIILGKPIGQVMEKIDKACNAFLEIREQILENVTLYAGAFESLDEMWNVRPPSEIKKELKHEKNPMRRKQLNRELNESYRVYRRKRG